MRIAFISELYYPYVKGGVERRYWEISRRLARKHEVHVFTMHTPQTPKEEEVQGVHVHRTYRFKELYRHSGQRKIGPAISFTLALSKRLYNEQDHFDIVDCSAFPYIPCYSAKKFSGKVKAPLVITLHEVWGNYWYEYLSNPVAAWIGRAVERQVVKWADLLVAVSNWTANALQRELRVDQEKIRIVPNGVDTHLLSTPPVEKMPFKILYVGRLVHYKHVNWLIEAMKQVVPKFPEASLHIVGDGPLRGELEALTNNLGLMNTVYFYGALPAYDDVAAHLKSASVFVSPSTIEGFGMAVLESMAASTPVVVVDSKSNAALDFLVDHENGLVVNPSSNALASAILTIFQDSALYERLVRSGGEIAGKYDWETVSKQLEAVYTSIIP